MKGPNELRAAERADDTGIFVEINISASAARRINTLFGYRKIIFSFASQASAGRWHREPR